MRRAAMEKATETCAENVYIAVPTMAMVMAMASEIHDRTMMMWSLSLFLSLPLPLPLPLPWLCTEANSSTAPFLHTECDIDD
jgi:hypothetical protein